MQKAHPKHCVVVNETIRALVYTVRLLVFCFWVCFFGGGGVLVAFSEKV